VTVAISIILLQYFLYVFTGFLCKLEIMGRIGIGLAVIFLTLLLGALAAAQGEQTSLHLSK
jgi:hypothetical protein